MDHQNKRGFIFFDMDETLGFFRNYDGSMNDQGFPSGIYLRPGIKNLLQTLKKNFFLCVSTAATHNYTKTVLEHSGLFNYFDRIFTRQEFVKLENSLESENEASPSGFEKKYTILMNKFNLTPEQASLGVVIGDNDYDISSDTPDLSTLIIDSLYTPTDIILAFIVDFFNQNEMDYSELGIKVKKLSKKHPISGLESRCFEIEIPESMYHSELDKVEFSVWKKTTGSRRYASKTQKERLIKSHGPAIQLRANRYGLI